MTKTDFDAKLIKTFTAKKAKHFLNYNDLSYYRGKQYFDEGSGKQNYLVFLPIINMVKVLWLRFQQCLGPFIQLHFEGSSETGLF